jgi:Ca-activated chloride channel family protein
VPFLAGLSMLAQQAQQPVFRGRIETVAVPVTVFDPAGELATALTRDDFTILDNGRAQTITTFSSGLQPIRAVVLVDVSASMMPVIDLALLAAEQFVIRLGPDDRAKVGMFSAKVEVSPEFTPDRDGLLTWLRRDVPFSNPTRLLDAIDAGITDLLPETGRRVVVVFTDGCDTASEKRWPKLLDRIQAEEVMVYAVTFRPRIVARPPPERVLSFGSVRGARGRSSGPTAPCALHHHLELSNASTFRDFLNIDDPRWTRGAGLVAELASETGGGRLQLTSSDDVNSLFTSVMRELHYLYLLGFTPQVMDGKVHELTVKVTDPKLVIRARRHFLASLPVGDTPARR